MIHFTGGFFHWISFRNTFSLFGNHLCSSQVRCGKQRCDHVCIDHATLVASMMTTIQLPLFLLSHTPTIIGYRIVKNDCSFFCGDCKIKIIVPIHNAMDSFMSVLFGLRAQHTHSFVCECAKCVYWITQALLLLTVGIVNVTHIFSHKFSCEKIRTKRAITNSNYNCNECLRIGSYNSIQLEWEKTEKAHKTNELKICNEYTLPDTHTISLVLSVYEMIFCVLWCYEIGDVCKSMMMVPRFGLLSRVATSMI